MKLGKSIAVFSALVFLAGCAGFIVEIAPSDGNGSSAVSPMSIHADFGGGSISQSDANDIAPFIYRDGAETYLIFSSDRGGDYDLYYCREYDGAFTEPRAFSSFVNSTNNNIAIYEQRQGYVATVSGSVYPCLVVLEVEVITNGTGTNINYYAYSLENGMEITNTGDYLTFSMSPPVIGTLSEGDDVFMLSCDGGSTVSVSGLTNSTSIALLSSHAYGNVDGFCQSASAFVTNDVTVFIYQNENGQFATALNYFSTNNGGFPVYQYSEAAGNTFGIPGAVNAYPHIDTTDNKLYFSAQTNGSFNLYRYNATLVSENIPDTETFATDAATQIVQSVLLGGPFYLSMSFMASTGGIVELYSYLYAQGSFYTNSYEVDWYLDGSFLTNVSGSYLFYDTGADGVYYFEAVASVSNLLQKVEVASSSVMVDTTKSSF